MLGSLRGRVALVATLTTAAILLVVGAVAVASFADRERQRVDEELASRPPGPVGRALGGRFSMPVPPPGPDGPGQGPRRAPRLGPDVLRPRGEYFRLISGGGVLRAVGVPRGLPLPRGVGLRTLEAGGQDYRSLTRPGPGGSLLEAGATLRPAEERIASLRTRLLLLGALGAMLVAALSWWLAGVALAPLRSLRDAAGRVSTTRDLSNRLSSEGAPEEIEELTGSVNAMLGRLQGSARETDDALEATRRFAGDVGHELRTPITALRANVGALRRNPDLDPDERRAALEEADRDAGRAMRLLEVLQTLARGDAGAALPREPVDLSALAETAVDSARSRHPEVDWALAVPADELALEGWPDGLRALVDNLLENAARHGGRSVDIALSDTGEGLQLRVDDDGAGVPPEERERIFERFTRGAAADGAAGSGLGLALVRQQARLHGGEVSVADSPLGGARFEVTLSAPAPGGAPPR